MLIALIKRSNSVRFMYKILFFTEDFVRFIICVEICIKLEKNAWNVFTRALRHLEVYQLSSMLLELTTIKLLLNQ